MQYFKDPKTAFNEAIARGYLTAETGSKFYAGNWMYMHSDGHGDAFKNIDTREYLWVRPRIA